MARRPVVTGIVLCILATSSLWQVLPAHAVDLNAELGHSAQEIKPTFKFTETIFVYYPDGGKLRDLLHEKNQTITITADNSDNSTAQLVSKMNSNLLRDLSLSHVSSSQLSYSAHIQGGDKSATIDYNLVLTPTITNSLMGIRGNNETILDAAWMGLSVKEPVLISTERYGNFDINRPSGLLQAIASDAYLLMSQSRAAEVLNSPLINSSSVLQHKVDDWQNAFDPAYTITETSSWGYKGEKVPITTLSIGQSSFGKTFPDVVNTVEFTLDKNYKISSIQHASSATMQIEGFASLELVGGQVAFVTSSSSQRIAPPIIFPGQVIYAMAGLGAAMAAGIMVWSNRKLKAAEKRRREIKSSPV